MGLIRDRGVDACVRLAQIHPYLWKLAWEAAHLSILLPHDRSYNAIRHFIAVKPHGLFLDVGANDGISALSLRKFSRDYDILSLEPNPMLEPRLRRIKARDPKFDYRIMAAGSRRGEATFFVPVYRNIVLHTFTSQEADHALAAITASFGSSVARAIQIESFRSKIVPLDELNLEPSIVKIDAEGFDYAILQGFPETIRRTRPLMIVEIGCDEYADIAAYFTKHQYTLLAYDLSTDRFYSTFVSWSDAVKGMRGHRNFFSVPDELLSSMPLKNSPVSAIQNRNATARRPDNSASGGWHRHESARSEVRL